MIENVFHYPIKFRLHHPSMFFFFNDFDLFNDINNDLISDLYLMMIEKWSSFNSFCLICKGMIVY